MKQAILDKLYELAKEVKPVRSARLAAAVVSRGKIIGVGVNAKKTHPLQARFSRNPESIFLHAEVAAVAQALKSITVEELRGCDLYIARAKLDKDGNWHRGLAKPCAGCSVLIAEMEFDNVYWTV